MTIRGQLGLLVVGAMCGLLLGKAVLGRVQPQLYERWTVGIEAVKAIEKRDQFNDQAADHTQRILNSGATQTAVEEQKLLLDEQIKAYETDIKQARHDHINVWSARLNTLIAAVIIIAGIEGVVSLAKPVGCNQRLKALSTVRHALLGVWLAMVITIPQLLEGVSWVFICLLVSTAVVATLLPVVKSTRKSTTSVTQP